MLCETMQVRGNQMSIKTYSELITLPTFLDRYLNQIFYQSKEWRSTRDYVIARDNGCDLGIAGHEIYGKILIHHMNPITADDILKRSDFLLNPEYLICTIKNTHDAIHYSDESLLITDPVERSKNDTCPWKH